MEIELGFNSIVNKTIRKFGEQKSNYVIVDPSLEKVASKFLTLLEKTTLIEIKAKDDFYEDCGPIKFIGYTIAKATGCDSGVIIPTSVTLLKGDADSGGSFKNWITKVKADTVFQLRVYSYLIEKYSEKEKEFFEIEVIDKKDFNLEDFL